jgi:predicted dehydrogenase
MAKQLQLALIGCGGMGTKLGHSLNDLEGARIAVCCDIDEARLTEATNALGADESVLDYRAAIANPDIDAVIIATPNHLHAQMAIDAARAGKHVYTEKPMALSVADCDAMIAAAKSAGVKLMVGQVLRYIGHFAKAKQIIDTGELGKPFAIEIDRIGNQPSRSDWRSTKAETGGMLPEVNVHELDFMAYVLGEPISIYAQSGHFGDNNYDFDDELFAIVRFEGGAIGSLHASFCAQIGRYHGKILCEKGAIFFGHAPGEVIIKRPNAEPEPLDTSDVPDPHLRELGEFLDAIRTDTEPKITGADGRRAIGMCQGADISAETGRVVELPL